VLVTLAKLLAPMVPFVTETMYQNLVRNVDDKAPLSVHHCEWPTVDEALVDEALLADMQAARTVVTLGHAVRAAANLKVRQPLNRVVVVAPPDQHARLRRNLGLITDELNVKTLEFAENEAELVTYKLMPENRALGPKFGSLFPKVRAALSAADPNAAVAVLRSGRPLTLNVDGQSVELGASDVIITPQPKSGFAVRAEGEYVVALDTSLTPELRAEGLAREVVRRVQDLRKTAGFDISDRVRTHYQASEGLSEAIAAHAEYIKGETLSVDLLPGSIPDGSATSEDSFDGESLTLGLVKVAVMTANRQSTTKPKKGASARKAASGKAARPAARPAAKPKSQKAKPKKYKLAAKPKVKPNGKAGTSRPAARPKPKTRKPVARAKAKRSARKSK
jgi:isoleucyl-tRNA synthetase